MFAHRCGLDGGLGGSLYQEPLKRVIHASVRIADEAHREVREQNYQMLIGEDDVCKARVRTEEKESIPLNAMLESVMSVCCNIIFYGLASLDGLT